jgi:nitroimidazol reductase NimA-like FMN-containing flavoprotein (pyridoxamine 5'-phosphate oxidase superfamily)
MSREEAEAFLHEGMRENWTMFLATNGPGGYPHIVSMGWIYKDDRILFQTYAKSQKIVNLRRDPKAAVILEALSPGGFEHRKLRGLMIRGVCETDESPEKVVEVLTAMWENGAARNRSVGARPQTELLDFVKQRANKRAVISFLPQKWASWDHSKLAAGTY